jgi:acetate kinase
MHAQNNSSPRLAINVGSSSIKTSVFNCINRADININFIGLLDQVVKVRFSKGLGLKDETYKVNVGDDLIKAADLVIHKVRDVLGLLQWPDPEQIGHRVKFAGYGPTVQEITEHQEKVLEFNDYLSSRHNSLCLAVIKAAKKAFPNARQLLVRDHAVGDISLHMEGKIPFESSIIRRYGLYSNGYHGLAIKACVEELEKNYKISKYTGVICQIGSGVSVSTLIDGAVKSNSMQFAACDGPVMHNRSGTQPIGLVLRMLKYGLDARSLSRIYNRESGIYGLANLPANSNITVEDILRDDRLEVEKNAYLLSGATEIFKATSVSEQISNYVFAGGLAIKHKWLGPELLYRAKVLTLDSARMLIQRFEKDQVFFGEVQGVSVTLVNIDEQRQICKEMEGYSMCDTKIDFSTWVCEVPGSSVGIVKEGASGWRNGAVCLNFIHSIFSFDTKNLPEAFIFFGENRNAFFLRAVFARMMKVPAIFIDMHSFDVSSILNKNVFIDTPTNTVVEL